MAYADTEFYKTKYYGDTVSDESLEKYLEKASDRIDNITFDRLVDGLCSFIVWKPVYKTVKGNIDGTMTGKMVSSVSSGAESISYVTGTSGNNSDIYSQAAMDKKVENVLLRQVATDYLAGVVDNKGVCLLYAGV